MEWLDYVKNFIESNEQIELAMFGKWVEIVASRATERVSEQQQLYKRSVGGYEPEVILVEQSGGMKPGNRVTAVIDQTANYRNSESYRRNVNQEINQEKSAKYGKQTTQGSVVTIQEPSKGKSEASSQQGGAQCDQTGVSDPVVESQTALGIGIAPASLSGAQVGEVVRTCARARRTESLDRGLKKGWTENAEQKNIGK